MRFFISRSDGIVAYTHNLKDSEFEKNNSFTIAPNTFHTIHNIGEYTYYQHKPRNECTYHFQRRKITKSMAKDIKDMPFPALAVSYFSFFKVIICELWWDVVVGFCLIISFFRYHIDNS